MGVVTDRRRVWRCFYHLPFLWLFNLNFQHVCSKLHSLTTIHYYLILSLVSFSYFISTSSLFIYFFLFLIVFLLYQTILAFTFSSLFRILHVSNQSDYFTKFCNVVARIRSILFFGQ